MTSTIHIGDTISDTRIPGWRGVVDAITYYAGHSDLQTIRDPRKVDESRRVCSYGIDPTAGGLLAVWPSTVVLVTCLHATAPAPTHHAVPASEEAALW